MDRAWSEAELAYLAGIVDGEGCLTMHRRRIGEHSFSTSLQVGNTDVRMIHWLHRHFGGSVIEVHRNGHPRYRPVWQWRAASRDLPLILRSLIPYLVTKKRQAELVIAYRATVNGAGVSTRSRGVGRSSVPITDDVKAHRSVIAAELTSLNRRGTTVQ